MTRNPTHRRRVQSAIPSLLLLVETRTGIQFVSKIAAPRSARACSERDWGAHGNASACARGIGFDAETKQMHVWFVMVALLLMSSVGSELRSTTRSVTALRNRLELSYLAHHVDAAIARTNLSILKPSEAYIACKRYIDEILIPLDSNRSQASHAPSPVVSSKKASCSPGLTLAEELTHMGFSDKEIQYAVTQGFLTVEYCVDFLLSQDCHESAPPSPALSPAAAASGIILAPSGTLLVSTIARCT
jgi:hypothetical protein